MPKAKPAPPHYVATTLGEAEQERRLGRPVTTGTTPAAERQRRSRAARAKDGGKAISLTLSPAGAEALAIIMVERGCDLKEAVEHALVTTAKEL